MAGRTRTIKKREGLMDRVCNFPKKAGKIFLFNESISELKRICSISPVELRTLKMRSDQIGSMCCEPTRISTCALSS